jgi:hypothetical protein
MILISYAILIHCKSISRYLNILETICANKFTRGGNDLREIILLLALFALIGLAAADREEKEERLWENDAAYKNFTTMEENSLKFNLEQNVSGAGFFNNYKYAQMPDDAGTGGHLFNGVEGKNKAHGSGKIDIDSTIYGESSYINKNWANGAYDEDGKIIQDEEEATTIIEMKENSKMTYSSLAMAIGSRYYNHTPVVFDSLLNQEDWMYVFRYLRVGR